MPFWQSNSRVFYKMWITFLLWTFFWLFLFWGFFWNFYHNNHSIENTNINSFEVVWNAQNKANTIPLSKMSIEDIFVTPKTKQAFNYIQQNFYGFDQKKQKDIENAFLTSLVKSLWDDYSEFFDENKAKEFMSDLAWDFEWIGAVVGENDIGIRIEKILKDSPAQKSDLKEGDIVLAVNGIEMLGKKPEEAVKEIRGKKWTPAEIEILRDKQKKKITIIRDTLHIPSVESRFLMGTTIGYLQVHSFGDATSNEFREQFFDLKKKWARAFVLDLRYNGWGYVGAAVDMLGYFLPKNTVISRIKENDSKNNDELKTWLLSFADNSTPLVVLVNEFSASASEIVSGALQDYNRAIIVGEKTFGKGSVQEMVNFSDGSMMKVTVANWYTPKDKNISKSGIMPDVIVTLKEEDYWKKIDKRLDVAQKIIEEILLHPKNFEDWKEFSQKYFHNNK